MNRPLKLLLALSVILVCQLTFANLLPYYGEVKFLVSVPKQTAMQYKFIGGTEGWKFDVQHSGCGDNFCHFTLLNKGGNNYTVQLSLTHNSHTCIANISGGVRTDPVLASTDCQGGYRLTHNGKPLSYHDDQGHEIDNSTLKQGNSGDFDFEFSH